MLFHFHSQFKPAGDQPAAIAALVDGVRKGRRHQLLHGITGSGKTFTMASVIDATQRPTLVVCHNKVLATQVHKELTQFFPHNAVELFTSDYSFFIPETYNNFTRHYEEKMANLDPELTRRRLMAIVAALRSRGVIVVASTSCLFDIGSSADFVGQAIRLPSGVPVDAAAVAAQLHDIGYDLADDANEPGAFAVKDDFIDIFPPYDAAPLRITLCDGCTDGLDGDELVVYPAREHMLPPGRVEIAAKAIKKELRATVKRLRSTGHDTEADRLTQIVERDVALLLARGYCPGVENYEPQLELRKPGDPPHTILGYLPDDTLVFVDESHVTIPQIKGAHRSDRSRKKKLIKAGYRLRSTLDACPLTLTQWEERIGQVIYVSATPAHYELTKSVGTVVEQVLRPTGLLDPMIEVMHASRTMAVLQREIRQRAKKGQRVLVMATTKKQAEELAKMLSSQRIAAAYLHGDLSPAERNDALQRLRRGKVKALVGINLLREGLDLPEVSLVAVLDADKRGFLRSTSSLLQMIGRAARNKDAKALLFAETVTSDMARAILTTERRRKAQEAHNAAHGIAPATTRSAADLEVKA